MLEQSLDKILTSNMMGYSKYVIKNRAIPDVRDGLKPAARNILITMNNMKLNGFTKSQNVAGQVMQIHPHGDCYDTIVGMVQTDNNLTPLIDGKGSFAQHTSKSLQPAAARYTEVQLSKIAKTMFDEIDSGVVDYVPTYDDKSEIPAVLPSKFPSILHYCQSGIAVGMNSSIPSYNLVELNNCVIKYLQHGKIDVLIPDFATGGFIDNNVDALQKIHELGEGSIKIRGTVEKGKNLLRITEIPHTTTREAVMESIVHCAKTKKLPQIANIKDLTGLDGMLIEITTRPKTNMDELIDQLYMYTPLESTFVVKMNVLCDGIPQIMGVQDIIKTWVEWRQDCIVKRSKRQLDELSIKLHKLSLEELIQKYQEEIINVLMDSETEEAILKKFMSEFGIEYEDAQYVSNFKLKNFNKNHMAEQERQRKLITEEVARLEELIGDTALINKEIIKELQIINKEFGKKRQTVVEDFAKLKPVETDDYIWCVLLTKEGYVKKLKNERAKYTMKDGDRVIYKRYMTNKDEILAFNKDNVVYKIKIKDIKECNGDMGVYLCANRQYDYFAPLTQETKYIVNIYKNSIAKIDADAYRTVNVRKTLKPATANYDDIVNIVSFERESTFETIKDGKPTTYSTKDIKTYLTRTASGTPMNFDHVIMYKCFDN